jgi:CheY-like chemotaxis protein
MNKSGPVIIIEDDIDDQEVLVEIFKSLKYENTIEFFDNGEDALAFIIKSDVIPFLILSDINMPRVNGFELKQRIATNAELQEKCIPFLFFTTSASKKAVTDAYSASAQGFFIKENKYADIKQTIAVIMEYWGRCYSPNQYHAEPEGI